MTKIKDLVKKEIGEILIKQGDMFYNERTRCYYVVTCVWEDLYNLYNINRANLFYANSMELKELDCMISNVGLKFVKDSELLIRGTLY